jgi:DDE superfamily endonuclease
VTAIPLAGGGVAILNTASVGFKMRRARVGPGAFPPSQRLDVMAMATRKPATYHCPATRWSLDDLVAALWQRHTWTMSRSSIWRLLEEADLKPHRSVYWLNSHDPAFEAKAHAICALYLNALRFFEQGRVVICSDEKTGMQILERKYPTQPMAPGKPEKREQEYIRHGTRALIASFVVPTGQVVWNLGQTRTSADFAAHWVNVVKQLPAMHRYDWVVDNLNTHWSLDVCRVVAQWCQVPFVVNDLSRGVQRRAFLSNPSHKHVFHFTPKHGSWLNQVELWFSVLARRFLKRGDFGSAQDFETRLIDYLEVYNTHQAHPYRWTYTGQPLVRATPFSQTRRQQRQGRAWFSSRPQRFERAFYPPRPYTRTAA